jgi:hypothetical protein
MSDCNRLMVVGHSGAGKDTACLYLAEVTRLRFAGTTSAYLARHVASRLGVSVQEAARTRHRDRRLWHRVGNEIRRQDPGLLVRESLEHAEITGGVRGIEEVQACRREQLVDLIVWIANDRVRRDSTVAFGPDDCDLVVPNHGSLEEFHRRLLRLARLAGMPMKPSAGGRSGTVPGSPETRRPHDRPEGAVRPLAGSGDE